MKENDPINHPFHYTIGGIETIDVMKAKSSYEEFIGHLRLTVMKYIDRGPFKENALKDYKKATWYLNRLIKEIEEHKPTQAIPPQTIPQCACPNLCPSTFGKSETVTFPMSVRGVPICQDLTPEQLNELFHKMNRA